MIVNNDTTNPTETQENRKQPVIEVFLGLDFGNGRLKGFLTSKNTDKPCTLAILNAISLTKPNGSKCFTVDFGKEDYSNPILSGNNELWFGHDVLNTTGAYRKIDSDKYYEKGYIEALSSALLSELVTTNCLPTDLKGTSGTVIVAATIATAMPIDAYYDPSTRKLATAAYNRVFTRKPTKKDSSSKTKAINWFVKREGYPTLRIFSNFAGVYPETQVYCTHTKGVYDKNRFHFVVDVGYGTTDYMIMEKGIAKPHFRRSTGKGLLELYRGYNVDMPDPNNAEYAFINRSDMQAHAEIFLNGIETNIAQIAKAYSSQLTKDNTTLWVIGGGTAAKLMSANFKAGLRRKFKTVHFGDSYSNSKALHAKAVEFAHKDSDNEKDNKS